MSTEAFVAKHNRTWDGPSLNGVPLMRAADLGFEDFISKLVWVGYSGVPYRHWDGKTILRLPRGFSFEYINGAEVQRSRWIVFSEGETLVQIFNDAAADRMDWKGVPEVVKENLNVT